MAVAGPATPNSELAPRLNLKAPSHLLHILEDFDEGVRLDAPNTALRALRQAFALLLGLSCDILGATCVQMGASAELYLLEKGQAPRLADSELRIKEALYYLSQNDAGELGKECASIFFDQSGSPRQFYLLTQGEGKMGGLGRLSEFCKDPRRAPGRSESVKLRNTYLPHLEAWLQAMSSFWDKSELIWERTDLEKQQRLLYKIYDTELEVGARIELNDCKACIPSRVLQTPAGWVRGEGFLGIPQEVPDHTLHLADRYRTALEAKDIIESTRLLRDTLEFLLRYFAGVGKVLCQELNCLTDEAQRFARKAEEVDHCERLLQSCVECLKSHQDDSAAKDFVGVFYRRDANLDLQPRSHTNILLLEGVLSSWFKQERGQTPSAERYTKDYERYFPLFRDWVRSMGPYFSHTEHFSDPPSEHGFLPLTVRCGEHLLELVEPEYQLRIRQCPVCLPNPVWARQATEAAAKPKAAAPVLSAEQLLRRANTKPEAEAAPVEADEVKPVDTTPKTFPGEFRPIDIPTDTPKFLSRVLRRLDVRVRRGELSQSRDALRDALDYLLRYWAGVTFVCARDAAKLSIDEEEKASKVMSIQDCEKILILCLKKLSEGANELSEEIIQVFYDRDLFSEQLKPIGGHTRMLQTDAGSGDEMQLLAEFCEMTDPCDLHRSRRDLKTFLPVLRDWLNHSQGFFEQCQHHEEEPDKEGRMELVIQWDKTFLELVAPDFAFYIMPGSDLVPDLEVPEWTEALAEKEEVAAPKPKVITSEELALSEPFLIHKVQYVGIQPNSQGVECKSGIISIQNAGGGSLTGRAFSNHPCIEVNPNRFREKTQLQYWLDEKSIPKDFVPVLVLRSGGDERQVTLAELRPLSKFATLTKSQGTTLLMGPAVGGFLLTNAIIIYFASKMQKELIGAPASLRLAAPEVLNTCLGYGSYVGATFLLYGALAPILALKVYQRFSHSLQDLVSKRFGQSLWLPIPLLLVTTAINCVAFNGVRHKEILNANLLRLTPWGIFFVLASSLYSHLENERKFAEWVQDPGLRKIIPAAAIAIFLLAYSLALS